MNVSAADTSVCQSQDQSSLLTFLGDQSQDLTGSHAEEGLSTSSMSDQESLTPPEVESLSDLETDATCDIDEKGEDTVCDDALPQTPDEEVYIGYLQF